MWYEVLPGMSRSMKRAIRYPKKFTCKAWNKFDLTQQDILCCRYDIILTDYQTPREKMIKIIKKFNLKNLNKGITKFNKGMSQFNKMMEPEKQQKIRKSKPRKELVYKEPITKEPELNLWGKPEKFRF